MLAFFLLIILVAYSHGYEAYGATDSYTIDPAHSHITFSIKHLVLSSVEGRFLKFSGTFQGDPDNLAAAKTSVKIQTDSIFTAQSKRDEHLKSADFFDAVRFPEISFNSKEIKVLDKQHFDILGDLTIHGITKPVSLSVEMGGIIKDPMGKQRAAFSATTAINRRDFGLSYNTLTETGGLVIGDEVKIRIQVEGIKN